MSNSLATIDESAIFSVVTSGDCSRPQPPASRPVTPDDPITDADVPFEDFIPSDNGQPEAALRGVRVIPARRVRKLAKH